MGFFQPLFKFKEQDSSSPENHLGLRGQRQRAGAGSGRYAATLMTGSISMPPSSAMMPGRSVCAGGGRYLHQSWTPPRWAMPIAARWGSGSKARRTCWASIRRSEMLVSRHPLLPRASGGGGVAEPGGRAERHCNSSRGGYQHASNQVTLLLRELRRGLGQTMGSPSELLAVCVCGAACLHRGSPAALTKRPVVGGCVPPCWAWWGMPGDLDGCNGGARQRPPPLSPGNTVPPGARGAGRTLLLDVPGAFGENLYSRGLTEADVCLGDRWRVGDVLLEVTRPASPAGSSTNDLPGADMARPGAASPAHGLVLPRWWGGELWADAPMALRLNPRVVRGALLDALYRPTDGPRTLRRHCPCLALLAGSAWLRRIDSGVVEDMAPAWTARRQPEPAYCDSTSRTAATWRRNHQQLRQAMQARGPALRPPRGHGAAPGRAVPAVPPMRCDGCAGNGPESATPAR